MELKEAQAVLDNFLNDPAQIEKIEVAAGLMADAIIHNGKILSLRQRRLTL